MKARILSTLILAGLTNLAVAGTTPVQQEKPQTAPAQQAPVTQQTAPAAQQAPVTQQTAPAAQQAPVAQQTAPAAQQAPVAQQTAPAAQQAAPTQALPLLTARERRAQRRAQRRASGQWTRIARPAVQ